MSEIVADHVRRENTRTGKTHRLATLCKEQDGIMICANSQEADRLSRDYNIKVMTIDCVRRGMLKGMTRPTFYDSWAYMLYIGLQEEQKKKIQRERDWLYGLLMKYEPEGKIKDDLKHCHG